MKISWEIKEKYTAQLLCFYFYNSIFSEHKCPVSNIYINLDNLYIINHMIFP